MTHDSLGALTPTSCTVSPEPSFRPAQIRTPRASTIVRLIGRPIPIPAVFETKKVEHSGHVFRPVPAPESFLETRIPHPAVPSPPRRPRPARMRAGWAYFIFSKGRRTSRSSPATWYHGERPGELWKNPECKRKSNSAVGAEALPLILPLVRSLFFWEGLGVQSRSHRNCTFGIRI